MPPALPWLESVPPSPAATAAPDEASLSTWEKIAHWFLGVPLQIAIVVVVTVLVIGLSHRAINRTVRKLTESAQERAEAELAQTRRDRDTVQLREALLNQRRTQRANAMGSLMRSTVSVIAVSIAVLTILPMLGVNIAPLLTSAGVLGVALGFGAQNLIKDYLSGTYIVLEDQYGVGDVVDLNGVVGTVEEVTLRVTRLRDLSGVVWYIRNGEIVKVANRSQGWTLATADIPVAPDTDLALVKRAVDEVAQQMLVDPELDSALLDTPTYAGVESVSGEATVVRVVAKAAATEQVKVGRILRERLKAAFDAAGIHIPVVVRFPGSTTGAAPGGGSSTGTTAGT